jgi:hypothetical protein
MKKAFCTRTLQKLRNLLQKSWLTAYKVTELKFLKSLWGLGTKEEEGYRTGPPG